MKLIIAVTLTDEQIKKIGWSMGNYTDDITDETECKNWIDGTLFDTIEELPLPPE